MPLQAECQEIFGGRLAILSNSAGLKQYDPDGTLAGALQQGLGVPVLRHGMYTLMEASRVHTHLVYLCVDTVNRCMHTANIGFKQCDVSIRPTRI